MSWGWDYTKIQEPCFVCECEDNLGQLRGTQSHPINCGWRVNRENKGYIKGLESIYNLCFNPKDIKDAIEKLEQIKSITISSMVGRYDIKDKSNENRYYFMTAIAEGDTITNAVTDQHPMEWQMWVEKEHPGMYVLLSWKEIGEQEYLIYRGGDSDGTGNFSGNSESMDS